MVDSLPSSPRASVARCLALIFIGAIVYLFLPMMQGQSSRPGHFPQLTRAFMRGNLSIEVTSGTTGELINTGDPDRFYCPYPPLPAVLLVPAVLLAGEAVATDTACRIVGILILLLFDVCAGRLPQRLGKPALDPFARSALTGLFAFGTSAWHNAHMAGDWHLAHAVALAAVLAALREGLGRNRPLPVGVCIGLAMLARPTTAFVAVFFALPLANRRGLAKLARLAIGPIAAVVLLGAYNFARFGTPFDFGYRGMILSGEGLRLMQEYGQFHPAFLPRNLFWFFLAPLWLRADHGFPWIGYDPRGLSLFFASPALIYALAAIRRGAGRPEVGHAWIAIALCLVPLLLYFNTGYWQFGHRFSMDYLPLLLVLVVIGIGPRPSRTAYALIAVSIGLHAWAVLLDSVARLPEAMIPNL